MLCNMIFLVKNNFLKDGITNLLGNMSSFSYFESTIKKLQDNPEYVVFTDQLSLAIQKSEASRDDVIIYCNDDLNIDTWTWLPSNCLSWKRVFPLLFTAESKKVESQRRERKLTLKEETILRMSAAGMCRNTISSELKMPSRTVNYLKKKAWRSLVYIITANY